MYEDEYEEYIINEILAEYAKVYDSLSCYLGFDQLDYAEGKSVTYVKLRK